MASQRRLARAAARESHQTYAFWFRNRYRLSPRDPRFLQLTPEEVEAEYWRVQFAEAPRGDGDEFEDDQFEDDTSEALERLESGEGWETVVEDLFGRDATV